METVEINKILHEFLGKCLHETTYWKKDGEFRANQACTVCDVMYPDYILPDYTSEESPRRLLAEVEQKFVTAFGSTEYAELIANRFTNPLPNIVLAITASALTRSTAMAEYLKEKK